MSNHEHVAILERGVKTWNNWRSKHKNIIPNLRKANLSRADLGKANLSGANLIEAKLSGANLTEANLTEANLTRADLSRANLNGANLTDACLIETDLFRADLFRTNLTEANLIEANLAGAYLIEANLAGAYLIEANLTEANLTGAYLIEANLTEANMTGASLTKADLTGAILLKSNLSKSVLDNCEIYGISVWDINLSGAIQRNLNISPEDEAVITVDDLEVAQFIYLLINNSKLRNVIDNITGRAALILGRFTEERKVVLDAIRDALRRQGYLPILFDFEKPTNRDLTETILTLASLSRFIIADLTDAKSIPLELKTIVPNLLSVAVQPIILKSQREFSMYENIARFPSVLPIHEYESQDHLISELSENVIQPAEQRANEMRPKPLG